MGVDTLRHHFCDVAAGLRATPRCWERRHSLWYWLGRISKASRIDKGERTCPVQAVARGLDTKVRGPLYDFFIKHVASKGDEGHDWEVVPALTNLILLMTWKYCTEAGRREGPAFPFFTIWYKQEGEEGVLFTEDDFRNLSSTEAPPSVSLEWTEEGYQGYQYWKQHFEKLTQLGPILSFLTSPERSAEILAEEPRPTVGRPTRMARDLLLLRQESERFVKNRTARPPKRRYSSSSSTTSTDSGSDSLSDSHSDRRRMSMNAKRPNRQDRVKRAGTTRNRVREEEEKKKEKKKKKKTKGRGTTEKKAKKKRRVETDEDASGDEEGKRERMEMEEDRARKQLLQAQLEMATKELELIETRSRIRQARARLRAVQAKGL